MPRPALSPLQEPHDERLARLGRAFVPVVEQLLEEGRTWADVSVAQLIKAVGISRSTFYVYFADKGELLRAVTEHVRAELVIAGSAWFHLPVGPTQQELRAALRALYDGYLERRAILGAVAEAAAYDPGVRDAHREVIANAVDGIAGHLREQQAAGGVRPDLDPALAAQWVVWMQERGLYQLVAPAGAEQIDRLLDTAADLLWRALYAPAG